MTNIIKQTVKYVNHLIEKLTGWIFGDAGGKHLNEVYHVKNKETGQKENHRLEKVLNNRNEKELINRFSKIAEHLPGVIYQYRLRPDGTSHFPYASDGIRQIYGVSPEDVLNDATPVFNVLHPDDFDRVRKTILESAKYFTTWHDEYRVNLPSGNTIWVEGNSTPQKLDDGSILWHGYIRDISDRKRTEEDLKKLTKAIEQTADSVLIININGVIEYVNPSFEKLSGFTKDEIIGKSPKDFKFSNEDINIYEELWNTVLTGKTAYGKLANHKKSGEKYFVEKSISPIIINNDGSITHFVSSEKDITDRIRLEIRERNRNNILTYIVEGMPLSKILNFIVSTVEQEDPTSICSILLLDEEGNHLINGAATSLPDFYIQAINGIEIGDGVGSCGAAAYSKKRVIVEDISTHPYWIPFRELAQKANLKSCWSEPIISSDHKLLGTFAIYHHEPKLPNQEDINQLKIAVDFAILAIERKRIEEQLKKYNEHLEELVEERTVAFKESEERFRIFFNSGSDAIFVTELKEGCPGKFIAVNDIACKRLGYSRDELLKMSPLDINSPGEIKQVLGKFKKLNLLENLSSESIHVTKEGKKIPVEINSNIINIEGRNGVLAIARDISLRKQAEKEYQTILHTSIDGFWITNSDGRFLDVNDAYCRMIGYTREELLKIQISDIEIKESPKDVRQHIKTLLERGFDRFESRHRCKNGKIIDVEISTQFSDVRGGVFVVFIKDITERKQTEKALRQSEEQLRLLLNSAGEAIYGIDLNGNCTFCNTSTLRFLGYKHPDDLIGKNMHSMIHFNHSDGTHYLGDECRIINAFQNNEGTHINNEVFCRADGTSFPVEYWSYPQQRDGKVIGAVITFFDITERRQAEEEIRKLSRIAEQTPATIVITNLKGDIEYANPSFTKVTGYSLKEAIGQNPRMLKSDVHPKEFYKNIWDIIISGNVWQGEL
ncbi:MAG TPA: PAS domain S-box protein, partial [Candidatus Deferrimicrobium sp.]|nr:PAS domain S-box protein [Candidatus Deferrimicrobium sp.]